MRAGATMDQSMMYYVALVDMWAHITCAYYLHQKPPMSTQPKQLIKALKIISMMSTYHANSESQFKHL